MYFLISSNRLQWSSLLITIVVHFASSNESTDSTTVSSSSSTAPSETTEYEKPLTRPLSPWIDGEKDEFVAQCYRLGKINVLTPDFQLPQPIDPPFKLKRFRRFLRIKRRCPPPILTPSPFQHPRRPPPAHYACTRNLMRVVDNRCHPPVPRIANSDPLPTGNIETWWLVEKTDVEDDPNCPDCHRPQTNITTIIEECCRSVSNQCDCFFRFGQVGTPSEGICEAFLSSEFQGTQHPTQMTSITTEE